ncbi:MAG: type II toxin-antitoxin system VapC family toxin [Pseudomonadota bacterium]
MLLDTCALIWLATGSDRLSSQALERIATAGAAYVSSISGFEVAHTADRGKIQLPLPPRHWYQRALSQHALTEIPIDGDIAALSVGLPKIHKDPCDRFIIATAKRHGLTIVTADRLFLRYDVPVIT